MPTSTRSWFPSLLVCLAVTFAAGGIGAVASVDAGSFYGSLSRPAWAPPASVFGPVWTLLYALMGSAVWLVWRQVRLANGIAPYVLFGVQLALNALWTWLFFAWRQGALAFFEVIVLLALIVATLIAFRKVRPLAGWLLVPYVAWVAFASALTWSVWQRNPGIL